MKVQAIRFGPFALERDGTGVQVNIGEETVAWFECPEAEWQAAADAAGLTGPLAEVADERAAQDAKWGGPDHDDQHTTSDWSRFIDEHMGRAHNALGRLIGHRPGETWRGQMIRVAALAVAAVESWDRKERQE